MNHIAAARAAALACCLAGAATESYAHADESCTRANVAVEEREQKVVVSFDNHCDTHVSCEVHWVLRCGKGEAQAKMEEVRIAAHSATDVTASALSCGDGDWRISPPRWRCDEPPAPVTETTTPPRRHRH